MLKNMNYLQRICKFKLLELVKKRMKMNRDAHHPVFRVYWLSDTSFHSKLTIFVISARRRIETPATGPLRNARFRHNPHAGNVGDTFK